MNFSKSSLSWFYFLKWSAGFFYYICFNFNWHAGFFNTIDKWARKLFFWYCQQNRLKYLSVARINIVLSHYLEFSFSQRSCYIKSNCFDLRNFLKVITAFNKNTIFSGIIYATDHWDGSCHYYRTRTCDKIVKDLFVHKAISLPDTVSKNTQKLVSTYHSEVFTSNQHFHSV